MEQTKAIFLDETEEQLKQQILEMIDAFLFSENRISDSEQAKKIYELVRRTYDI